jgi:hypothetical protein
MRQRGEKRFVCEADLRTAAKNEEDDGRRSWASLQAMANGSKEKEGVP